MAVLVMECPFFWPGKNAHKDNFHGSRDVRSLALGIIMLPRMGRLSSLFKNFRYCGPLRLVVVTCAKFFLHTYRRKQKRQASLSEPPYFLA